MNQREIPTSNRLNVSIKKTNKGCSGDEMLCEWVRERNLAQTLIQLIQIDALKLKYEWEIHSLQLNIIFYAFRIIIIISSNNNILHQNVCKIAVKTRIDGELQHNQYNKSAEETDNQLTTWNIMKI